MPKCFQCGVRFPNRVEVEGKMRSVNNRKYCLDCSPFGQHNTRKVEIPRAEACLICGGKNYVKATICRYCTNKIARWRLRLACIAYKGGKCE